MKTKITNQYGIPMYVNIDEIDVIDAKDSYAQALRQHMHFLSTGHFSMEMIKNYEMAMDAGVMEAAINLAGALLLQAHLSVNYKDKIFFVERLKQVLNPFLEMVETIESIPWCNDVTKDALYIMEVLNLWGLANTHDIESLILQEFDGRVLADTLKNLGYDSPTLNELMSYRNGGRVNSVNLVSFDDRDSYR